MVADPWYPGAVQHHDFELMTPRLTLRPLADEDVAALVRHWGDEQVRRYLWDDKPVTYDMVTDIVTTSNRDFKRAGYGIWAVRLRGDDALIGMCGLREIQDSDWTEILYSLRPRFWRSGYATEAAGAVLEHAFKQLGLQRVFASFDGENVASSNVLRRLGMLPVEAPSDSPLRYWQLPRERYLTWSVPPSVPPPANS